MVVLDLEWNTVFSTGADGTRQRFDEIIQIGAVRLAEGFQPAERFNAYIHNQAGSINRSVAELVQLSDEKLENQPDFMTVAEEFLQWCGENPRFLTWSNGDIPVLRQNFLYYGLNTSQIHRAYNVQFAYSILKLGNANAVALNKAVESYGMEQDETFHSAVGDAVYTARIMQLLWQEFGVRTREGYLYGQLQKLRAAKNPPRVRAALVLEEAESLEAWLREPWRYSRPLHHKKLSSNTHRKAYFRQISSRSFECPHCKKTMNDARWLTIEENRYVSIVTCPEHGSYYALMRLRRKTSYLWEGVIDIYAEKECALLAQWVQEYKNGATKE